MPKSYFSVERCQSLSTLPPGGRIHVIGVCGVAMAQLAVLLAEKGYRVSGSDKEFYEPMASYLQKSPVQLYEAFNTSNIQDDVQLAVIGNSVSYERNEEVWEVEKRGIPYTFFSKALYEAVIKGKHSIVIAGTHGKSTTSALCAHTLNFSQKDPSYFIGAQVEGLEKSLHAGSGGLSVVEGDEYDSAFFAKVPKFDFYAPDTFVITSIEFDHADIYSDIDAVNKVFKKKVSELSADQNLICCSIGENVSNLLSQWKTSALCKVLSYGKKDSDDVQLLERESTEDGQQVFFRFFDQRKEFFLPLFGEYNALNGIAVYSALALQGITHEEIREGLRSFGGVVRRQQIKFSNKSVTLIEDFAHHPTAVRETLSGIKERFPAKSIWAVFEPRSNTSRRRVFEQEYLGAFEGVSQVLLSEVAARPGDEGLELLSVSELSRKLQEKGILSHCFSSPQEIKKYLLSHLKENQVIVVMSNGSFGNLIFELQEALRTHQGQPEISSEGL